MTIQEQLAQLEAQRTHELKTAGYLYVHTKRQAKRAVSPERFARKHIGLLMAAAAAAGMVMAPAPRYVKPEPRPEPHGKPRKGKLTALDQALKFAAKYVPGLAGMVHLETPAAVETEAPKPEANGHAQKTKSPPKGLILELATLAATKINWNTILKQTLSQVVSKAQTQIHEAMNKKHQEAEPAEEKGAMSGTPDFADDLRGRNVQF